MSHPPKRKPPDLTPIVDAGREYYKLDPDAMLVSVARKATAQYASKEDQLAFLNGYQLARLQHEQFLKEQHLDEQITPAAKEDDTA